MNITRVFGCVVVSILALFQGTGSRLVLAAGASRSKVVGISTGNIEECCGAGMPFESGRANDHAAQTRIVLTNNSKKPADVLVRFWADGKAHTLNLEDADGTLLGAFDAASVSLPAGGTATVATASSSAFVRGFVDVIQDGNGGVTAFAEILRSDGDSAPRPLTVPAADGSFTARTVHVFAPRDGTQTRVSLLTLITEQPAYQIDLVLRGSDGEAVCSGTITLQPGVWTDVAYASSPACSLQAGGTLEIPASDFPIYAVAEGLRGEGSVVLPVVQVPTEEAPEETVDLAGVSKLGESERALMTDTERSRDTCLIKITPADHTVIRNPNAFTLTLSITFPYATTQSQKNNCSWKLESDSTWADFGPQVGVTRVSAKVVRGTGEKHVKMTFSEMPPRLQTRTVTLKVWSQTGITTNPTLRRADHHFAQSR